MRRHEVDYHETRPEPPPFRVLSGTTSFLSPTSPPQLSPAPPSRAPDPYKVAPGFSSQSYSRAHRRSSFVIIAEARPATPNSRSSSPTLATGRVSPFRGRGFKGPPPHAQSRPQTPDNDRASKRERYDRRVSVSQQSSPKRSLIPQPVARSRSISLSKSKEQLSSPKPARRPPLRNNVNNARIPNQSRRPPLKSGPSLSPIRGTPTKEKSDVPRPTNRTTSSIQASKNARNAALQVPATKTASNSKKASDAKTNEKIVNESPSKIPLRRSSVSGKSGKLVAGSAGKPVVGSSGKPPVAPPGKPSVPSGKYAPSASTRTTGKSKESEKTGKKQVNGAAGNASRAKGEPPVTKSDKSEKSEEGKQSETEKTTKTEDVNLDLLTDFLKQPTGPTGTHTVVNTTTATAVQPLQIDAPVSVSEKSNDAETAAADSAEKQKSVPNDPDAVKKGEVNSESEATLALKANAPDPGKKQDQTSEKTNEKSALTEVSKTENPLQSASTSGNVVANEVKQAESSELARDKEPSVEGNRKGEMALENRGRSSAASTRATAVNDVDKIEMVEVKRDNEPKTLGKTNDPSGSGVSPNSAKSGGNAQERGNSVSLKSSAGKSSNSIGSVRSTDTGVSLNTVRGISSAREKVGTHMVKRAEEIETLSGNIVHVESNGEPNVPTTGEAAKQTTREKLLSRLRKSLGNYCKCCPGDMRCLACRRDPKGFFRTRSQPWRLTRPAPTRAETAESADRPGRWTRLKNACRCSRLRESKLCIRRGRIAPADNATCCPPERRFGALCRRLLAKCNCNCNCKRPDAQRTRSVRAKHSLTSVAAPPLSEEPKAKIPDVLVEHNSLMRGAIPCLPIPLAWFCLVWNVLLPGSGTFWSGVFNLCTGQPRFSAVAGPKARFGAFVVNLIVGVGQLFTVLFCLVGWGWSIWWGINMIRLARKYKRFKDSEAANSDPEARVGETAAVPSGAPSQSLRGVERAR